MSVIRQSTASHPVYGSLIYCKLGPFFHTGIFIGAKARIDPFGDQVIVQLNGKGSIEKVTPEVFTNHFSTLNKAIFFPIDKITGHGLGIDRMGHIAREYARDIIKYNPLHNNCHKFSSKCINGVDDNITNLKAAKRKFEKSFVVEVEWIKWKWGEESN
jgi:hypothetical protein